MPDFIRIVEENIYKNNSRRKIDVEYRGKMIEMKMQKNLIRILEKLEESKFVKFLSSESMIILSILFLILLIILIIYKLKFSGRERGFVIRHNVRDEGSSAGEGQQDRGQVLGNISIISDNIMSGSSIGLHSTIDQSPEKGSFNRIEGSLKKL